MFIPDFFRKGEDIIDGDKNIANGFNDFFPSLDQNLHQKYQSQVITLAHSLGKR